MKNIYSVLFKNKTFVCAVTAAFALAGAGYSVATPDVPEYEYTVNLSVIGEGRTSPAEFAAALAEQIEGVSVSIENSDNLKLTLRGSDLTQLREKASTAVKTALEKVNRNVRAASRSDEDTEAMRQIRRSLKSLSFRLKNDRNLTVAQANSTLAKITERAKTVITKQSHKQLRQKAEAEIIELPRSERTWINLLAAAIIGLIASTLWILLKNI